MASTGAPAAAPDINDPSVLYPIAGARVIALAAREAAYRSAGCVFCDIVHGDKPCHKLYEDDSVLAFLDIRPLGRGHTLLVPKAHCERADAADPEALAACMRALPAVSAALLGELKYTGFTLLQNNGRVAGQEVPHVHFHVIPRCEGDALTALRGVYAKCTSMAAKYSDPGGFAAAVARRVKEAVAAAAAATAARGAAGQGSGPASKSGAAAAASAGAGGGSRGDAGMASAANASLPPAAGGAGRA
jgi:histidine triad (HIT) family protein